MTRQSGKLDSHPLSFQYFGCVHCKASSSMLSMAPGRNRRLLAILEDTSDANESRLVPRMLHTRKIEPPP